ncbi:MAG: FtsX-like permease family protein [Gammaproteobacteria bacterium]
MSPELVDAIKQDIEEVLEKRRGSRTADFLVTSFAQAARAYLDGSRTMALLLGSVAGISLLVGGIGIMNMMLTNAAERSREIGVWLAIGTRRAAVQAQFLLEAALLSGVGSTVGVAFGATCAYVIASLNSWAFALSPLAVLVIICGGMGVGLVFGWLPARRAAQLDPIQVLRAS